MNEPADHQQGARIFEFLHQIDALVVNSTANIYIKISARSCLKALGAGGSTAKPRNPPKILYLKGVRFFYKAPVNLRIFGGFAIQGDGSVDGFRYASNQTTK